MKIYIHIVQDLSLEVESTDSIESIKKQIGKWLDIIKKISEMERNENENNAKDLKEMEKMLNEM